MWEFWVTWFPRPWKGNALVVWPVILYRRGWGSPALQDRVRRRAMAQRKLGVLVWWLLYLMSGTLPAFTGVAVCAAERGLFAVLLTQFRVLAFHRWMRSVLGL